MGITEISKKQIGSTFRKRQQKKKGEKKCCMFSMKKRVLHVFFHGTSMEPAS